MAATVLLIDPILIVGCGRSGTSLMRSILRAHPQMYGIGNETRYVRDLLLRFGHQLVDLESAIDFMCSHENFPIGEIPRHLVEAEFHIDTAMSLTSFVQRTLAICLRGRPGVRLLMKDPDSVLSLDDMAEIFPSMRILHIVRDPRAVVSSHLKLWPQRGVLDILGVWRATLRRGERWGSVHRDQYFKFKYEDLLNEPEKTLASLCDFLGIAYLDRLLHFQQPADYAGGAGGLDLETQQKWKRQLTSEQVHLIETVCRDLMDRLGYGASGKEYSRVAYIRLSGRETMTLGLSHLNRLRAGMRRLWRDATAAR